MATGTVILGPRAQQFSGSFIAAPAAPRRSLLYYRSEVECTTPFHHVLLPLVGAHRVAAADLPHTSSDGRKLLARKTCQLARDVQEYAPV